MQFEIQFHAVEEITTHSLRGIYISNLICQMANRMKHFGEDSLRAQIWLALRLNVSQVKSLEKKKKKNGKKNKKLQHFEMRWGNGTTARRWRRSLSRFMSLHDLRFNFIDSVLPKHQPWLCHRCSFTISNSQFNF